MCGIHLIVDKNSKLSDESAIGKMVRSAAHRGPDNQAILAETGTNSNLFFACNQLQITDDSVHSAQPFSAGGNKNILLYNGEIYNYLDLSEEFLNGLPLLSKSDTEVLFNLLNQQGKKCLDSLNGMYAVCFYSSLENRITLARDPSGIKPLYYYESDDFLIVSSEIKSILASGLVKAEINPKAVQQYLQFRHCQFPETFFRGIKELPPGLVYEYEPGKNLQYSQSIESNKIYEQVPLDSLDDLLLIAVERHLIGIDTPALCLSGGIDSTLLLAKIHQIKGTHFPVYCTSFNSRDSNSDYIFAKRAAKLFQADFHFHEVDQTCLDRFDEFIDHLDQPIGDSGAFATMLLTEEISKHYKSALSGAGADELFGGYNRHLFYLKYLNHQKGFTRIGNSVGSISRLLDQRSEFFRLLSKLSESIGSTPYDTYRRIVSFTRITCVDDLPDWDSSTNDNLVEALRYDRNRYLVSDILAMSDQMSMKNSVELRTPYLDREIVKAVTNFEPGFILKNGRKWILKKFLSEYPNTKDFINRRKRGYGLPFDRWISLNPSNMFRFLDNKDHYLFQFVDRQLIYDLYMDHINGSKNNVLELWNVAVLARWFDKQLN